MLDLDSFAQVPRLEVGPSSAGIIQQELQENIAVSSKGKEKEVDTQVKETFTMTEQPQTSKGQDQVHVSSIQTNPVEMSIFQTPLNMEKGKKREAEAATPLTGYSQQPHIKRQKLNTPLEVESIDEILDSQGLEQLGSQQTETVSEASTTSQRKELQKQQSVEISSFKTPVKDTGEIKKTFINIKAKNDPLRIQVYNQFLKMAPKNQERLMSSFDIQQRKMIMSHFKPKVQQPQTATDYITTKFEVLAKDIHPLDQIELHKKTGEMIYSTLTDKAMAAHRLQDSLENTNTQLQLEKASSEDKDNRIKTLE